MIDPQVDKISSDYCTLDEVLQAIAGRHKLAIVYAISRGHHHFGQLARVVYAAGRRTLAQQLKELIQSGLVVKTQVTGFPPQTHYALTPKGGRLLPIIEQLCTWGLE